MFKSAFLIFFSLTSTISIAQIQDFESFKNQQKKEFSEFENKAKRDLDSLRMQRDQAFAKMLSGNWTREELFPPNKTKESPKPTIPPQFVPDNSQVANHFNLDRIVTPSSNSEKPSLNLSTNVTPQSPELSGDYKKTFTFKNQELFGNNIDLIILHQNWPKLEEQPSPTSIAEYWQSSSKTDYPLILKYIQDQINKFGLSDWATYQLIKTMATNNFENYNDRSLFCWYILVQLGYDARIMYSTDHVILTLPFDLMIYGKNYFVLDDKRYFMLEVPTSQALFTYTEQHEGALRTLNLSSNNIAVYPENWKSRELTFTFDNKIQIVSIPFLTNRSLFDATIPQTELSYYFNDPLPVSFSKKIHEIFDPKLNVLPDNRAKVRYLYAIVCQGIPYKTDDEQFNQEKFCLPEESLLYPFADCEDRTFLLNALIRELVGVETIGLDFPNHVAMAVKLDDVKPSDSTIRFDGENFIYCDPTFLGADLGMMPESYKKLKIEVFK